MGYCYLVTNEINEKCYVGITTNTLKYRKCSHLYNAFKSNSQLAFHRALRKHGAENFHWQIVYESSSFEELKKREIMLIQLYGSHVSQHGYNMTFGGDGTTGWVPKEETKLKISIANTGKKLSEETKKKISIASSGKKISEERVNKMIGRKHTEETRKKMSMSAAGRKHTKESINKMSEAKSGENNPMFGKTGEKAAFFGRKHTEESINKMKESRKLRRDLYDYMEVS